ncbi:MAG: alpha/beta hydrolase [Planctomycetaceae bacterium]
MDLRQHIVILVAVLLASPYTASICCGAESVKVDGVRIAFSSEGSGDPVVLIHGLHSSTELNWRNPGIIKMLAKNYRVICLDLPGHGESDKPESKDAYGLQMVHDVARIMEHLKVQKAHIVGYSLGGMVALKFADEHPEMTLSVTLCGMGWMKEGGLLQRFWNNMAGRESSRTPEACVKGIAELALSETELKAISQPVTVIIGSDDPAKRLYVKPLQAARPDWPVVEISGGGHLTTLKMPEFHAALINSLNEKSK